MIEQLSLSFLPKLHEFNFFGSYLKVILLYCIIY